MEIFGRLSDAIRHKRITIPKNQRLIDELHGLRVEEFSKGGGWRVLDSDSRLHRDLSYSLALAVHAAYEKSYFGPLEDEDEDAEWVFDAMKPETYGALAQELERVTNRNDATREKRERIIQERDYERWRRAQLQKLAERQ